MTNNNDDYVPDGEAGGDGAEEPLIQVPDDASGLDVDSPVEAPTEGSASERAASEKGTPQTDLERAVAERTADLQRLQAEYVNYKRRVDRDRGHARERGIEAVVLDLLPVLDSIEAARQHEELTGGFKMVADSLEKLAGKYGLIVYGELGEPFDPNIHEALMHVPYEGDHDVTVVSSVMQKGARLGERVIRPARVGVADPSE